MMTRIAMIAGVLAGAAAAGGCSVDEKGPVVTIIGEPEETKRVPFTFTNPYPEVLTYAIDPGFELYGLGGTLYHKNGEVGGRVMVDRPSLKKDQIRTLKPGESVTLYFTLPYVEIRPGHYELCLCYNVPPGSTLETDFGLTPMKWEQTIRVIVRRWW